MRESEKHSRHRLMAEWAEHEKQVDDEFGLVRVEVCWWESNDFHRSRRRGILDAKRFWRHLVTKLGPDAERCHDDYKPYIYGLVRTEDGEYFHSRCLHTM